MYDILEARHLLPIVALLSQAALCAQTIVTIDVPGANGITASAINGAGVITGWYTDTNVQTHAFRRDGNGGITTFDVPQDARGTFATCISDAGEIAGYVAYAINLSHAFVRTADGNILRFDPPGAVESKALAINAAGDITGWFADLHSVPHGFMRAANGTITTFDAPGSGPNGVGASPRPSGPGTGRPHW